MIYQVEVYETLTRLVDVEADDKQMALDIANEEWECGRLRLGSDDFADVKFQVFDN